METNEKKELSTGALRQPYTAPETAVVPLGLDSLMEQQYGFAIASFHGGHGGADDGNDDDDHGGGHNPLDPGNDDLESKGFSWDDDFS